MVITENCSVLTFAFQILNRKFIILPGISLVPKGFSFSVSQLQFFVNISSIAYYTDTWFINTQMEVCSPEMKVSGELLTWVLKWHVRTEIPRNVHSSTLFFTAVILPKPGGWGHWYLDSFEVYFSAVDEYLEEKYIRRKKEYK